MLDSLFTNLPVMQQALHGLSARQRAIGENIANVDTPGYKALEVTYEQQLKNAMQADAAKGTNAVQNGDDLPLETTTKRHYSLGPGSDLDTTAAMVGQVSDESFRNDKNGVDIDSEMANLAETNMRYETMASLAHKKFDGLMTVLREIH